MRIHSLVVSALSGRSLPNERPLNAHSPCCQRTPTQCTLYRAPESYAPCCCSVFSELCCACFAACLEKVSDGACRASRCVVENMYGGYGAAKTNVYNVEEYMEQNHHIYKRLHQNRNNIVMYKSRQRCQVDWFEPTNNKSDQKMRQPVHACSGV